MINSGMRDRSRQSVMVKYLSRPSIGGCRHEIGFMWGAAPFRLVISPRRLQKRITPSSVYRFAARAQATGRSFGLSSERVTEKIKLLPKKNMS